MKKYLKQLLIHIIEARQEEANRRIAMMQLRGMTDRELRDIGIGRGQIKGVVYDDKEAY